MRWPTFPAECLRFYFFFNIFFLFLLFFCVYDAFRNAVRPRVGDLPSSYFFLFPRLSFLLLPSFFFGTSFYFWPLPSLLPRRTDFYRVFPFWRCVLGLTGFDWVLLGFTGFYRVLVGFTGSLLGLTKFYWVLLDLYKVLLGFTRFCWVLLGLTGFDWVLLGFTGSHCVLLCFT